MCVVPGIVAPPSGQTHGPALVPIAANGQHPATTWQQTRVLTSALLSWQLIVRQPLRYRFRMVRICRSHRVCALGAAAQAWSARYPARVAGVVLCHRPDTIIVCQGSD